MKSIRGCLFICATICLLNAAGIEQIPTTLPSGFAPMIENASKNVVYLMTSDDSQAGVASPFAEDPWFRPYYLYPQLGLNSQKLRRSIGSGVILSSDGIVVTSARFIEGRKTLKVVVPNYPQPFDAKILGSDLLADIAVLKVIIPDLPQPSFADITKLSGGDLLFAIGNPFGLEPIISMGVVSALGIQNEADRFLQGDLFIHGGNIGGAIINAAGELVGIPVRLRGMNGRENQGGFFLPIDRVRAIAKRIEQSGNVKEAWLGIAVSDLTQEMRSYFGREDGVVITAVEPYSPAEQSGLKKGDLIVLADNVIITDTLAFERILSTMVAERDIVLLYMRDRRLGEVAIRSGRLENSAVASSSRSIYHHGMVLENLTPTWRDRLMLAPSVLGVVISDVESGSPAQQNGFEAGDVIIQANDIEITSLNMLQDMFRATLPRTFLIMRDTLVISLDMRVSASSATAK